MSDELKPGEMHGGAYIARRYLASIPFERWAIVQEALASSALAGNELADICLGTIKRMETKQPVSDRYLMGLAWVLWGMENENDTEAGNV